MPSMYNPCAECGGTSLVLFISETVHKGVEPGTRCLICAKCKRRFGSVDNWNRTNPKQEQNDADIRHRDQT